jgi:hypothetical protein
MDDTAPPQVSPPPRIRPARWFWAVGTVLLVATAGLTTWHFIGADPPETTGPLVAATEPARLVSGHDYYLHVKLIELTDRRPDGKAWDRVGDSGPDIRFTLTWRRNVIWKSIEKPDTLIGSWDLLKVDLKQILTSGGQTDLEGLVNAPLVHYERGERVDLLVWDADALGSSDAAGTIPLRLDDLSPGENTLTLATGKDAAVKRVVLSLIDRRTPVPELVDTISKR